MGTVRVLQLGNEDYSETMPMAAGVDWIYEPDLTLEPEKDFDVVILGRDISREELETLRKHVRAYCVFIMDFVEVRRKTGVWRLSRYKMGKIMTRNQLADFLSHDVLYYYHGSYGEKFRNADLCVAQGFSGSVSWEGYQGVTLEGDYGDRFCQAVFWRNNIPIAENDTLEFWLEYAKDPTVEIALEITQFLAGSIADVQNRWFFSERELEDVVYVENTLGRGWLFVSLRAKGRGKLKVVSLHDRHSRGGYGVFLPGGKRAVTSEREEVFYYFDPGNRKPPLNVYFSGYKTKEGFEGYYMMRRLEHPFLLITECRLEGGGYYIGSEEYEEMVARVILRYMKALHLDASQVIFSGISMGTFGALYYGCRIRPAVILLGKPLASLGDVAAGERLSRPEGSHTCLDVLYKATGGLDPGKVQQLNAKFWDRFDAADWRHTRFAVAYMMEDDGDRNAYANLQSHLKYAGTKIYGKGIHGRHNDDTPGIVGWFLSQYRALMADADW